MKWVIEFALFYFFFPQILVTCNVAVMQKGDIFPSCPLNTLLLIKLAG